MRRTRHAADAARNGGDVAAIIVEPVQSRRPDLQPREFLKELREIATKGGAALVFDDVVTGFRSCPGGAQEIFGVRADIVTYGKVVGGGMPIGIVAGSAHYLDALDGGGWQYGDDSYPEVGVTFFAGTFVRHPLSLASARAVLQKLKAEGPQLQRKLNRRTTQLVQEINAFAAGRAIPLKVTHFSSMFYFNFPPDLPLASLFFRCCAPGESISGKGAPDSWGCPQRGRHRGRHPLHLRNAVEDGGL
ncbi:MAG: aminotransferase class III-fold pyridoxal phosphate-dependent enzyme [Proteobacteria bacterium]|nr:aminotransferase class III-fold pyridoxal phosphate-dependent enzyme [Pseudomonadota bacterium]